jgi:hypothetical protein
VDVGCWVYGRSQHPDPLLTMKGPVSVTAHPVDDADPDDPVEILRVLPDGYHSQFLAEYEAAVDGARRPQEFRRLHDLLRLWRLRALAYSDPGYEQRLDSARHGVGFAPADRVIPDWPAP